VTLPLRFHFQQKARPFYQYKKFNSTLKDDLAFVERGSATVV